MAEVMERVNNKNNTETTLSNVATELVTEEVDLREKILDLRKKVESSFVELAETLYEVYTHASFAGWGFENFKEYCEEELQIKYRRCAYMVSIAQKVEVLGLSWDDIKEIGWTKSRALIPILGSEQSDRTPQEWIDRAHDMTVKAIEEEVKTVRSNEKAIDDASTERTEVETKYTFTFDESQMQLLADTLETAKSIYEVKNSSDAMEAICYHWSMENADQNLPDLSSAMSVIEKVYGVKLKEDDENQESLMEIAENNGGVNYNG